ncbi:MAG: hypothetical protein PWP04_1401 [Candidatus Atribacteria bacterium]|nr:hypothetical protein [Candidatus Atribacteria bacterium]
MSKKVKSRGKRWAKIALIIVGVLIAGFFLIKILPFNSVFAPFFHVYSKAYTKLIEPLLIDDSGRVLVFAPHPDDETLTCGGVIQKALTKGKTVKVVFVTSGDSFGNDYEMIGPPEDLPLGVALGYLRQKEALEATAILGLEKGNVIFLGYPDRGMEKMWWTYRSGDYAYRSPYTQTDRSPYLSGYTISAPYLGEEVLRDIQDILETFQPQIVYLPHPSDLHADHWATYNFVKESIERLRQKGSDWINDVEIYLYLVHFGRMKWPPLWGYAPSLRLIPPSQLMSIRDWIGFELNETEVANKKKALDQYQSQQMVREFLLAFVKANEFYAIDNNHYLRENESIFIPDEKGEFTIPKIINGGDIQELELIFEENTLILKLHHDSGAPPQASYRFYLIGYSEGEVVFQESYLLSNRKTITRLQGNYLSYSPVVMKNNGWVALTFDFAHLPLPEALFLSVESFALRLALDRLPWSMIILEK